jgi:hypothetical protein
MAYMGARIGGGDREEAADAFAACPDSDVDSDADSDPGSLVARPPRDVARELARLAFAPRTDAERAAQAESLARAAERAYREELDAWYRDRQRRMDAGEDLSSRFSDSQGSDGDGPCFDEADCYL